jgi:branched-chain amino acid transport system ATP-binding protein
MRSLLDIEDVTTGYDKADVLQGVSLTVETGLITCLLGSNGAGKTTLVRSILGLTPAASSSTASTLHGCPRTGS